MLFSSNHKTLSVLVLIILFFGLAALLNLSSGSFLQAATSPDAIAFRVMPNPGHLSPLRWYQENIKLKGSPQTLVVDGYNAVRDGRTVYVNAANIDLAKNNFYTNIYIISYNQAAESATVDIFGQILARWKFNTNVVSETQKDKIRNDTRRLADLSEIKSVLNSYQAAHNNFYPVLSAGSYISGRSLSVWPSWQAALAKELGVTLPEDPSNNKLGVCDPLNSTANQLYDPVTCWDQKNKKFAGDFKDFNNPILPDGSRVYVYSVNPGGKSIRICAQLETENDYPNIKEFNCFADRARNSPPEITGATLTGKPKIGFTGWISMKDADNDTLSYIIEYADPGTETFTTNPSVKWKTDYDWQWEAGADKFTLNKASTPGQIKVSAAQAGKASRPGLYKIKVTVDDGQGQANSIVSRIFEISIDYLAMSLTKEGRETMEIGTAVDPLFSLQGQNNSGRNFSSFNFRDSFAPDGLKISPASLDLYGFFKSGMSISEKWTDQQKTGDYTINVRATDPTTNNYKDASFQIKIENHPPVINSITATYADKSAETSTSFIIDNGEDAKIQVAASDFDRDHTPPEYTHAVSYALIDNDSEVTSKLHIDASGVITGLKDLNYQLLADKDYIVTVKASDKYCNQSTPAECSVTTSFNLTVNKYCSLTKFPVSTPILSGSVALSSSAITEHSGQSITWGDKLKDYSEVGNGKVDIEYIGTARSSAIIFVLDLSDTMTTAVGTPPSRAIDQLKKALVKTDSNNSANDGVFENLYDIGLKLTGGRTLKIGLVGFNNAASVLNPNNIFTPVNITTGLSNLKAKINSYSTNYETHTLAALNKAEQLLQDVTGDVDKYVVLMSDGLPAVIKPSTEGSVCYTPACTCGGSYPTCNKKKECPGDCAYLDSDCKCQSWDCTGGSTGTCSPTPNCPCGYGSDCKCFPDNCHTGFNNNSWLKIVFDNIFGLKPALATEQTQCLDTGICVDDCVYGQTRNCWTTTTNNCDISDDVKTEAERIKDVLRIKFYSIYFDTKGVAAPGQRMCDWSSNDGLDCDKGPYFFSGTDISTMFDQVLDTIVNKPRGVEAGNVGNIVKIADSYPREVTSPKTNVSLNPVLQCGSAQQCGQMTGLPVIFDGAGSLIFSNLTFDYCPAKLH